MDFGATKKLANSLRVSPSEPISPARRIVAIKKDSDSIINTAKRLAKIIIGTLYDFDESLKDATSKDYPQRVDFVVATLYTNKHRTKEESRTLAHISSEVIICLHQCSEDENDTGVIHPCAEVFQMAVKATATKMLIREWDSYSRGILPKFTFETLRSASTIYADLVAVGVIEIESFASTLERLQGVVIPARGLQGALLLTIDVASRACTVPAGSDTLSGKAWTNSLLRSVETLHGTSKPKDLEVLKDFVSAFGKTDMSTGVLDWTENVPSDREDLFHLHSMCSELWKLHWPRKDGTK